MIDLSAHSPGFLHILGVTNTSWEGGGDRDELLHGAAAYYSSLQLAGGDSAELVIYRLDILGLTCIQKQNKISQTFENSQRYSQISITFALL